MDDMTSTELRHGHRLPFSLRDALPTGYTVKLDGMRWFVQLDGQRFTESHSSEEEAERFAHEHAKRDVFL